MPDQNEPNTECLSALEALERLREAPVKAKAELPAELQRHLASCPDCLSRSLFEAGIIATAAELPMETVPAEIETNVMAAIMAELNQTKVVQPPTAVTSDRNPLLLAASFAVFALMLFSIDSSIWNLLSWALSLVLILLFKPIIESPNYELKAGKTAG